MFQVFPSGGDREKARQSLELNTHVAYIMSQKERTVGLTAYVEKEVQEDVKTTNMHTSQSHKESWGSLTHFLSCSKCSPVVR